MGYYAPSFGRLDQGWYFKTTDQRYAEERDRCVEWWNAECDAVVEDYLCRYGMFLSAFENSIKDDIRTRLSENVKFPDYLGMSASALRKRPLMICFSITVSHTRKSHATRVQITGLTGNSSPEGPRFLSNCSVSTASRIIRNESERN
jgi:hypothetical protein